MYTIYKAHKRIYIYIYIYIIHLEYSRQGKTELTIRLIPLEKEQNKVQLKVVLWSQTLLAPKK